MSDAPATRPVLLLVEDDIAVRDVIARFLDVRIAFEEKEPTESLREKLSGFYAERTLLKKAVSPVDVSEACFLLASDRLSRTTGQIIAVDAGLAEAFLR